MPQPSAQKSIWRKLEAPCLVVFCWVLAALNVRAQWTGIATDPSFTAWIAPISNRLKAGPKLYEWGTHMPLPPLSHVVLYLFTWGHATWLTESFAHQTAVMLAILMLYFFLRDVFPRPVAFLGSVAALCTASMSVTILFYNSLTHVLVMWLAVLAAGYFRKAKLSLSLPGRADRSPARWRVFLWLGVAGAATILSKQSIGGMAVIGCAAVIWLAPDPGGLPARIRNLALYGLATGAAFGALCLLMFPWVNPRGLLRDVFITGTECKGGTGEVLGKLGGFTEQTIALFGFAFFVILVVVGSKLYAAAKSRDDQLPKLDGVARLKAVAPILLFLLFVTAMGVHKTFYTGMTIFASAGLGICLFAVATIALPALPSVSAWREFAGEPWQTLGVLTLVLLPAAMGYNLSGPMLQRDLNWCSGNIPLCQLALVALFWLIIGTVKAICRGAPACLTSVVVFGTTVLTVLVIWLPWAGHWKMLRQCTDTWSHCEWFKGARVTGSAQALHEVVQRVRKLAGTDGSVLLLPDDPNFEACLDQPRPPVSCAIIYADQYWKRYVKDDFQLLSQTPPKIIMFGPENDWRAYGRSRNPNKAVEDLVDQIQKELLPTRYHLEFRQTFPFGRTNDTMAVYVRND